MFPFPFTSKDLFCAYEYFAYMYVYVSYVCLVHSEVRIGHWIPDLLEQDDCELPSWCWEWSLGPLQEQQVAFTAEQSPQTHSFALTKHQGVLVWRDHVPLTQSLPQSLTAATWLLFLSSYNYHEATLWGTVHRNRGANFKNLKSVALGHKEFWKVCPQWPRSKPP